MSAPFAKYLARFETTAKRIGGQRGERRGIFGISIMYHRALERQKSSVSLLLVIRGSIDSECICRCLKVLSDRTIFD